MIFLQCKHNHIHFCCCYCCWDDCVCVSFLPLCCFYEWNDKFCVILLFREHTCCFKSAGVHIALVLWVGVPYKNDTTTTIRSQLAPIYSHSTNFIFCDLKKCYELHFILLSVYFHNNSLSYCTVMLFGCTLFSIRHFSLIPQLDFLHNLLSDLMTPQFLI